MLICGWQEIDWEGAEQWQEEAELSPTSGEPVCVSSRRNVATRAWKGWLKERTRIKAPLVRRESAGYNSGRFF